MIHFLHRRKRKKERENKAVYNYKRVSKHSQLQWHPQLELVCHITSEVKAGKAQKWRT